MQNDALSHGLWEMTAPRLRRPRRFMARCEQTWRLSAAAIRGSRRRCIALKPGPRLSLWRRSRSVSAAPGATSAWSTPACGLRLTKSRRGSGPAMASGCSNCSAMGPRGRGPGHQARPRLRILAQRHAPLRDRAGGPRQNRTALRAMGLARRAGEASQSRRDGEADRRRPLCRLIARPARRHDPAAGLRARACARRARHRRGVHTESPVRSAERTGKAWRLKTDGGSVTADWIVVATDAYAEAGLGHRASGSRSASPISTSPPARSAPSSGPRSCQAARAAGTRG